MAWLRSGVSVMGYTEYTSSWAFFGFMFMIFFGTAVIWLLVWFVEKRIIPKWRHPENDPINIIDQRYAKGELSKEEHSRAKRELTRE